VQEGRARPDAGPRDAAPNFVAFDTDPNIGAAQPDVYVNAPARALAGKSPAVGGISMYNAKRAKLAVNNRQPMSRVPELQSVSGSAVPSVAPAQPAAAYPANANLRAGQDAREPSRLSIASMAQPAGSQAVVGGLAGQGQSVSYAPASTAQFARSLSASTSSLGSVLPSLRETLKIGTAQFDPVHYGPAILEQLNLNGPVKIDRQNMGGGQNQGIWSMVVFSTGQPATVQKEYILKLVAGQSIHPSLDSEPDNLVKLAAACPGIREDTKLAFPVKIIDVLAPSHQRHTLLVMPKASGERFGDWMTMTCFAHRQQEVIAAVQELGRELRDFHVRYGNRKHADFSPSNIYYDPATKSFTFIDLGGVGTQVMNDDVQHFIQALSIMGGAGGPLGTIVQAATQALKTGYQQR
jgi:hypothetical protein